jgi:hypothetical protein
MSVTRIYPPKNFYILATASDGTVPIYGTYGSANLLGGIISIINDHGERIQVIDTDGTLSAYSDRRIATQKAVKDYVSSVVVGIIDPINMSYVDLASSNPGTIDLLRVIGGTVGSAAEIRVDSSAGHTAGLRALADGTGAMLMASGATISSSNLLNFTNTTNASAYNSAAVVLAGGLGVAKRVKINDSLEVNGPITTPVIKLSSSNGSGTVDNLEVLGTTIGSIATQIQAMTLDTNYVALEAYTGGYGGRIYCSGSDLSTNTNHTVTFKNTLQATAYNSASFMTDGGVGIAKDLRLNGTAYVHGDHYVDGETHLSTQQTTGNSYIANTYITSATVPQMTIGYDGTNKASISESATGNLTIGTNGPNITLNCSGTVDITSTLESSDKTHGALVVPGGIACAKNLNAAVGIFQNTTPGLAQLYVAYDSSKYTSFITDSTGDMTIDTWGNDLNFHSTDSVHVLNTNDSSSYSTGSLQVSGGLGLAKKLYCNDAIQGKQMKAINTSSPQAFVGYSLGAYTSFGSDTNGYMSITSTGARTQLTDVVYCQNVASATSSSTGCLRTTGGVGIGENLYVGGIFRLSTPVYTDFNATPYIRNGTAIWTTFNTDFKAWRFDNVGTDDVFFQIGTPTQWVDGENIICNIAISRATSVGGNINFTLFYSMAKDGQVFTASANSGSIAISTVPATAELLTVVSLYTINMTGYTFPTSIYCRLVRDIGAYAGNVWLHGVSFRSKINKMGA